MQKTSSPCLWLGGLSILMPTSGSLDHKKIFLVLPLTASASTMVSEPLKKCKSRVIRFFSFYELCGSLLYNLNISYPQLRNNLGPLISFKKENKLNKNRNLEFHLDILSWLYETIRPATAVCRFL